MVARQQFVEKAFVPDSIEVLTHVEQDSDGGQMLVVGVRQMGNNPDELKGCLLYTSRCV